MSWGIEFLLYIGVLAVLLVGGQWIAFALGTAGVIALYIHSGPAVFSGLGSTMWNNTNSFVLTAVPLFVFMGEVILRSGISERFYRAVALWLGRVPGGLLHSNIVASGIFAAICGSSVATAAAIGTVAIPELGKQGYDRRMVLGSLAAGGTLGILIPPSIPLILYGAMVDESVARLFMAGVIPGTLLVLIYMAYIAVRVILQPELVPKVAERVGWGQRLGALRHIAPFAFLILLVLGGIWLGFATPTEAAALGAFASVLLAALYRGLTLPRLTVALAETIRTTCFVLFIIVGANIFSFALVNAGITRRLTEWVVDFGLPPAAFMGFVILLYIFLGCIVDGISMMLLTLPVLYPIIVALGFNPIWFGVIMVVLIELGLITPPVGLNLFVIHGISGGRPISEVIEGCVPYFFLMMVGIGLVIAFPDLALWLPSQMVRR